MQFLPKVKLYNARVMNRKYEALTEHVSLPIKTVDGNVRRSKRQRKNAALAREAQMRMVINTLVTAVSKTSSIVSIREEF